LKPQADVLEVIWELKAARRRVLSRQGRAAVWWHPVEGVGPFLVFAHQLSTLLQLSIFVRLHSLSNYKAEV